MPDAEGGAPRAGRPDEAQLRAFLDRLRRRIALRAVIEGATGGAAAATALALAGWPPRDSGVTPLAVGMIAVVVGALGRVAFSRDRLGRAAHVAEQAAPECRNLLVTAEELLGAPAATSARVRAEVMRRALQVAARLDLRVLFPFTQRAVVGALVFLLWSAAAARATNGTLAGPAASATPMIDVVELTITPPQYTGRPPRTVRDPDRVEVLVGSRITLQVRSNATAVRLSTVDTSYALAHDAAAGRHAAEIVAETDGLIALDAGVAAGAAPNGRGRRLIGITVLDDAAPRPVIVRPGRDLLLPDGKQAIDVTVEAADDIALATLTLRYTKVTGSGERFTFVEGEVPVAITRRTGSSWTARARWQLDSLGLEPGDMVVYRAAATDGRPGAAAVESDAFIAEVASPGGVAAAGFAIDPEQERYALSQQMIVLKAERLLARRQQLASQAYADSAAEIASEQRRVRAEFIFMMGGELNDGAVEEGNLTDINEEAEAEAESDLLAGREANLGRLALRRATRSMSRAARELTDVDVAGALVHARAAVEQLEQAFARNRIILRALAEREELDPARRLGGALDDVARPTRAVVPAAPEVRVTAIRAVLAAPARDANDLVRLAERILRIDPSARALQEAASAYTAAASALGQGDARGAGDALERGTLVLSGELKRLLPGGSHAAPSLDAAVARGALGRALRGRVP